MPSLEGYRPVLEFTPGNYLRGGVVVVDDDDDERELLLFFRLVLLPVEPLFIRSVVPDCESVDMVEPLFIVPVPVE